MADWKTRLAVSYKDEDKNTVNVTPIDSFTPTLAFATEPLHSLEATHIGAVVSPITMTFSMTVKAMGDVAGKLTALAMRGKRFDVTLQESGEDNDWSFKSLVMANCIITSAAPTNATLTGVPTATFSGFALGATADTKSGAKVDIP